MYTHRGRTAPPTFVVSGPPIPAQLTSMEVTKEVWAMVGKEHQDKFIVVGGAALLLHGYPILTDHTDLAITADSLYKFEALAKLDPRFSQTNSGDGALNLIVDFVPISTFWIRQENADACTNLAIAKGGARIDRQNENDLYGFKCAVKAMTEKMLNFKGSSEEKRGTLDEIMIEPEGIREERGLLRAIRTLL
ncbi:hypothetical protein HOY82DRAFT_671750 [Tuber indicum]|nr:hypothetical protein HOY82DRAFT_671750 [Tuber indicum]